MRERLLDILGSPRPTLMAIVGVGGALAAGRSVRGGVDIVQVRAKEISSGALMRLVRDVIAEVGDGSRVIVNSRADIAERAGAAGVHLPESGLDPREVKRAFPRLGVSVSRHDRLGLKRAAAEGVDFAILGPVLETPGKADRALGLQGLRAAVFEAGVPVLGVGGLTSVNASDATSCGLSGVAAIRPFSDPATAFTEASRFRAALDVAIESTRG